MIKKLYKSFAIVTMVSIFTRLLSFLFNIYLSRRLGAETLGVFHIAISVYFLFSCLSSSGLPTTLSRKIAHYDAVREYTHSEQLFAATLSISLCMSSIICLFFYSFPKILSFIFTNDACNDVFLLLLPGLFAGAIYCTVRAWFWGKKNFTLYSVIEMMDEIMLISVVIIFLAFNVYGNEFSKTVAIAHTTGDTICAIITVVLFGFFGGNLRRPKHVKEISKASAPITTSRILANITTSFIAIMLPNLIISAGLGDVSFATAEYGRMSGMVMPITMAPSTIVSSLTVVMLPEIATNISKKNFKSLSKNLMNSVVFSVIISAMFTSVFLACGKDIGVLFYDDKQVGSMITCSAFIIIPLITNQLFTSNLNGMGKENWTFTISTISSILLILTLVTTTRYIGVYSYILGLAIYHVFGLVCNAIKIRKITKCNSSYLIHCAIIAVYSILIGGIGYIISTTLSNENLFARLAITAITVGVLIAIPLFVFQLFYRKNLNRNGNL